MCPVECLDCCGPGGGAERVAEEGGWERKRARGGADYMSSAAAFSSLLDYLSKFYGKQKRLKHKQGIGEREEERGEKRLHLMPDLQPGWGPRR